MIDTILTFLVNLLVYGAVLCIWIALVFTVFKIPATKYFPFGWIGIFFEKVLQPFALKIWELSKYLFKVLFKWLLFSLEQFWYFLIEIFRKLIDLLYDPEA